MWKKTFLFLGIFMVAFCIGYYCGHLVNKVYEVKDLEFMLGILFMSLSIVTVYCAIKIRDKKIIKEIHKNQIKVEPSKKFPLYRAYNENSLFLLALLAFLPLLIYRFLWVDFF